MKPISTLLLFLTVTTFSASAQKWKITGAYNLALPQQEMGRNINAAHSLQAGVLYQLPVFSRLSVGAEFGLGTYANKMVEQTFQFDDNTTSVVPVNYSSNTFNANFQTRLDLLPGKKMVMPYVNAKAGVYNLFSNVYIEDPNDPLGCKALQQKNLINDKTIYWSAGGGLQVNPGIFSKNSMKRGGVLIDIGANWVKGGTINYINTRNLMDATAENSGEEGKPVTVQFINVGTQQLHEHKVAQLHTSALSMLEFRVGVVVVLD